MPILYTLLGAIIFVFGYYVGKPIRPYEPKIELPVIPKFAKEKVEKEEKEDEKTNKFYS